jgi:integrase
VPKILFSDVGLRTLSAPQSGTVDYWDKSLPSFGCRVSQGGTKTFVLKVHNSRRAIGRYPIITLGEARAEAKRLLAEKTLGKSRPMSMSVKSAQKLFIEEKKMRRRWRTVRDFEYQFKRHYNLPGQVQDVQFSEMLRRLERIKSPSSYNFALAAGRAFFNWCMRRRYIRESPVMGLSPRYTPSRSRVLTDDELKAVWIASDQCGAFGDIVKLLILTGQRRGEVSAFRSNFFSKDLCKIPASLAKNGREHTFPIGIMATSILSSAIPSDRASDSTLLFPARGKPQLPFNGWSKGKAELDKLSAVTGWTLHDLRRTFATGLAELGVAPHVTEKLLNHVTGTISGVAAIYNRHRYEKECRAAIEAWEAKLLALLEMPTASRAA